MKKETFVQGVTILEETFNRTINRIIAWEILGDRPDEYFLGAVKMMVRDLTTLYPNDNLVAIVKEYCQKYVIEKIRTSGERKKITNEESDPPPPEFYEMMKKIGKKV